MFHSERRVSRMVAAIICSIAILLTVSTALGQGAHFQGLGNMPAPDGRLIEASDVSVDGSNMVGFANSTSGVVAFRRQPSGNLDNLGHLPAGSTDSRAFSVSADGSVVVGRDVFLQGNMSHTEAFRWTMAGITGLGDLDGGIIDSSALGVSDDGSIVVGRAGSSMGQQAFRWTEMGGMTGLGDLPGGIFESIATGVSADGSVVVGSGNSDDGVEAFRWTALVGMVGLGDLPGGGFDSAAVGISADGKVVVGRAQSASGQEAFRWTQTEGMMGLGDLPGGPFQSVATDASANGTMIVGEGIIAMGERVAFIWNALNGMQSLRTVLEVDFGLDLTGWKLERAQAVSDDGRTIVGFGRNPSGQLEAWMAKIPLEAICSIEPATDQDHNDPHPHGDRKRIVFDVSGRLCDEQISALIDTGLDCEPIPVNSGTIVKVEFNDKCRIKEKKDHIKIKAPQAILTVKATDCFGNVSTCETDLMAVLDDSADESSDDSSHDGAHNRDVENTFTPPFLVEVIGAGQVGFDPQRSAYNFDEVIVLNAIPDAGWRFDHWEGSISGDRNPHALTVGEVPDKVVAVFTKTPTPGSSGICGVGMAMPAGILLLIGCVGWRRMRRRKTRN